MTYKLITPEKLKISLTPEDLELLGIEDGDFESSPSESREALLSLLEEAKNLVGFDPDSQNLLIEIFPGRDNGCLIYYTALGSEESDRFEPAVISFSDSETLIGACVRLFDLFGRQPCESALYGMGGGYFMVVHPTDAGRTVGFLTEYGRCVAKGELAAAYVEEHGDPIVTERAVDTISYYFNQ